MQLLESGLASGHRPINDDDRDFFNRVETALREADEQLR